MLGGMCLQSQHWVATGEFCLLPAEASKLAYLVSTYKGEVLSL